MCPLDCAITFNCSTEYWICNTNITKKETVCDPLEVVKYSVLRSQELLFGLIIIINNVIYKVLQRHENWRTYQNTDPKTSHKQRKIFKFHPHTIFFISSDCKLQLPSLFLFFLRSFITWWWGKDYFVRINVFCLYDFVPPFWTQPCISSLLVFCILHYINATWS